MLQTQPSARATLGRVGLPTSIRELASKRWDAIIVGGGHNGLTCAAYLARAGKQVLVLEARERLGGACTIEETWAHRRRHLALPQPVAPDNRGSPQGRPGGAESGVAVVDGRLCRTLSG